MQSTISIACQHWIFGDHGFLSGKEGRKEGRKEGFIGFGDLGMIKVLMAGGNASPSAQLPHNAPQAALRLLLHDPHMPDLIPVS